jgi:hypothetical protein
MQDYSGGGHCTVAARRVQQKFDPAVRVYRETYGSDWR